MIWAVLIAALAWVVEHRSNAVSRRRLTMLSAPLVIGVSFAYLLLLFAVATGATGAPRRGAR